MGMRTYIISILLLVITHFCAAQVDGGVRTDSIKEQTRIAVNDIIGDWYRADSTASKISFNNINDVFVEIDGIKHGVGKYSFRIVQDSISVHGSAANWPPYDCTLKLVNAQHLEIEFYQFHSAGTTKTSFSRKKQ
jgi:hypothetical protein